MARMSDWRFIPQNVVLFDDPGRDADSLARVERFDGPVEAAPPGLVLVVDHGEHATQVGMNACSIDRGTFLVGMYNGYTLVTEFVGDRERLDKTRRNKMGRLGAFVWEGPDTERVEKEAERITAALPQLAIEATHHAAVAELKRVKPALRRYEANPFDMSAEYELHSAVGTLIDDPDLIPAYAEKKARERVRKLERLVEWCEEQHA